MTQNIKTKKQGTMLSSSQIKAVNAPLPTLVMAAAGTGKTTTIVARIAKAYRVDSMTLDAMFVTTFTRKAAQEMTSRTQKEIGSAPEFMGTFHRNGLILMKKYPALTEVHGYKTSVELIDATDRDHLLAELLKPHEKMLKELVISKNNAKKWLREGIDSLKNRGLYPVDFANAPAMVTQQNIKDLTCKFNELPELIAYDVFVNYQVHLKEMNMVDFNDVIALPVFAMRDDALRNKVSSRFKLVIVDEFQDCSALQFEMAEQLSDNGKNLYLVGDEDQLIYGWRDASLEKVMEYLYDPKFHKCFLEENYRSTTNIVSLAAAVITQNRMRSEKVIRSARSASSDVVHLQSYDNKQEAEFVVSQIKKLIQQGVQPNEIAIIYRTNDYSLYMETQLVKEGIDYDVVKAYNFFEYKENKDVVAYLRLAMDNKDDMAFRRIINYPKRKNGKAKLNTIELYAHRNNCSLFEALGQQQLSSENEHFISLIDELSGLMEKDKPVKVLMRTLTERIDLEEALMLQHGIQEGEIRMERVKRLSVIIDILKEEYESYTEVLSMLNDEMASIKKEPKENKVQLMTIHGSKGLEFEHVFIIGAVNGMIPSLHGSPEHSDETEEFYNMNMEEERRLFYVAVTRAKDRLVISSPKYIYRFGSVSEYEPTMFLNGLQDLYKTTKID